MKQRFWIKVLFGVVLLLTTMSFVACEEDREEVGTPYLELDIEELPLTLEGGNVHFTVLTNRPWQATLSEGSEWIAMTPMQGVGRTEVELSIPASDYDRKGEVQFQIVDTAYELKTLVVKQGDVSKIGLIYSETFGAPMKDAATGYWPYANENSSNCMSGTGVVAGLTTYDGYGVTARMVGTYTAPTPPTSGEGHLWFPAGKTADKNFFEVQQLALHGTKNIDIRFYLHGNTSPYKEGDVMLHLSADGEKWSAVAFTTGAIAEAAESTWVEAQASVTLKEAPEQLYMRFSSTTAGGCRLDDPTILQGVGGVEVDLAAGTEDPIPTPEPEPEPDPTPDPGEDPTPSTATLLWHDDFSQFDGETADGTVDLGATLTGSLTGFKEAYTGSKVYAAAGKIKLGSASKKGTLTTPALKASGTVDATMTVDLAAWANVTSGAVDSTKIKIVVNGGGTINGATSVDVTLSGEQVTYTYALVGVSAATTITFESATASKQRYYLDNLKITQK